MSIAKLKLFNLTANTTDLDQVLTKFVDLTWIHPVPSYQVADKVHGLAEVVMDNPYIKVLNTIKSIEKTNNFDVKVNKTRTGYLNRINELMVAAPRRAPGFSIPVVGAEH